MVPAKMSIADALYTVLRHYHENPDKLYIIDKDTWANNSLNDLNVNKKGMKALCEYIFYPSLLSINSSVILSEYQLPSS